MVKPSSIICFLALAVGPVCQAATAFAEAPQWAKSAIWYQIYTERFRNGDPTNDPTPEDIRFAYPGFVPDGWKVTPWGQDWYEPDTYFAEAEGRPDMAGAPMVDFGQLSRLRRYGGDLQGVLDKLDYLESLGITAIYFNPLNDAPSDHKYDAANWRHIDRNFGPDPRGDAVIMEREQPDNPATWEWTAADRLFLSLIRTCHERGIRVVMDYSWNHTGIGFWAWQDLVKSQQKSQYKDWYWVEKWDDPGTPENEFSYRGWFGVRDLPEIRETEYVDHTDGIHLYEGDIYDAHVKEHIFAVARRWLDPDGDGNPADGIDGFRLDVCAELPLGFWRDFRKVVRGVNSDAYLVGEAWFEVFPDQMLDPEPLLRGNIFDAVMNYRWYRSARNLLKSGPDDSYTVSQFVADQEQLAANLRPQSTFAMMNVAASHDTPRLLTSLYNRSHKYMQDASPTASNDYKIDSPDEETYKSAALLLAHQFTWTGAPHIYMGDEVGMWSAIFVRKPMVWSDIDHETERVHPFGKKRTIDPVRPNIKWFRYYQKLTTIRKNHPVLADGETDFIVVDNSRKLLAYRRFNQREDVIAAFNLSDQSQALVIPATSTPPYQDALRNCQVISNSDGTMELTLPPRTAAVLVSQ